MARDVTTTELLASIKRRGGVPSNQPAYPDSRILAIADDEMQSLVVPTIMRMRSDFFLAYSDVTVESGSASYQVPSTAVNLSLKNVVTVDSSGREGPTTRIDDPSDHEGSSVPAYLLKDDRVVLYPDESGLVGRTLRMKFYRLPNRLVAASAAARVISADPDTGVVTTAGVPASWTTSTSLCAVSHRPNFGLLVESELPSDVSSPTVTLSTASAALLSAGDYLAEEGDSPIPQVPLEARPLVAQAAVCKILEGLGDPKLQVSQSKMTEIMAAYVAAFEPRVEQAPKKVVSHSKLSDYVRRGRFGRSRSRFP